VLKVPLKKNLFNLICREQKLKDNIFRCHYTLSGLHLNSKQLQKALQCAKAAITISKECRETEQELDAQLQLGLVRTPLIGLYFDRYFRMLI